MKSFGVLLIIFTSNFISSDTLICEQRIENPVDFNAFMERDNSNITYLTLNNGTKIEACEYVDVIHDCYNENGELIEEAAVVDKHTHLKYYSQDGNTSDVHKFNSYFECLNYLIQDGGQKDLKIFIKKYLHTNEDVTETAIKVRNGKIEEPEIFCNHEMNSTIFKVGEKTYSESYRSKMNFIKSDLIVFGAGVSVPFLPVSLPSENYKKTIEKNAFSSSWTRTRPSQNVTVPAESGKMLSQQALVVKKLKKYTANFVINDNLPEEDSQRFKNFRQKLRSGEVSLHQRKHGIQIDFSSDYSIEVRNLKVREYVTKVTKMHFMSDAASCDELYEIKDSLTFEKE